MKHDRHPQAKKDHFPLSSGRRDSANVLHEYLYQTCYFFACVLMFLYTINLVYL